nr:MULTISPECIES: hypothetical protein [Halorubrum]
MTTPFVQPNPYWGSYSPRSVLTMIVLFVTLQRYYKQGMVAAVAD